MRTHRVLLLATLACGLIVSLLRPVPPAGGNGRHLALTPGPSEGSLIDCVPNGNGLSRSFWASSAPGSVSRLRDVLEGFGAGVPLSRVDEALRDFMADPALSRRQKLDWLWDYARTAPAERAALALDFLRAMRPMELTEEFIAAFDGWDDTQKPLLVDTLRVGAIADAAQFEEPGFATAFADSAHRTQDFLRAQLQSRSPSEALDLDLLRAFCDVSAPAESLTMLNNLIDQWFPDRTASGSAAEGVGVPQLLEEWYRNAIGVALAEPQTMTECMPRLLDQVRAQDPRNEWGLDNYLYALAEAKAFEGVAADSLAEFLADRRPDPAADSKYYHWLNATVRMAGPTQTHDVTTAMSAVLAEETQPLDLASAVIYGGDALLQTLPGAARETILKRLTQAAATPLDEEVRGFLDTAVEALSQPGS